MRKIIEFNVKTTPFGRECGLRMYETVRLTDRDENSFEINTDGALLFVTETGIIVYAKDTWATVTSRTFEE